MNKIQKRILVLVLSFVLILCGAVGGMFFNSNSRGENKVSAASVRKVERLDRGLVALKSGNGIYLSWRLLGTETKDTTFNVYRNGSKIANVSDSTNYFDANGNTSNSYVVKSVLNNQEISESSVVNPKSDIFFDIPISKPADGRTPDGKTFSYSANDCSVADLDNDGEYEIILKWEPSNSYDNATSGYSGNQLLDAYKLNGKRLWRIDMGINIRSGAHYTQFMVFDYDSDGYAEMVCKTADGTIDGTGGVIGNRNADYRDREGRVLSGPEYLTLFDGKTGKALDTINYEPARGNISSWGDNYGNRVDRFLGAVAYLNGTTPSVVMCRGYYTRSVLVALDVVNKKLKKRWTYDSGSNTSQTSSAYGQGNHNLAVADVDNDGYDEIVYGSATIDHNGNLLYSTGLGHGDAMHVGDFIPNNGVLEVYQCHEATGGSSLRNAKTGQIIYRENASGDTGRCIAGNFVPGNDSYEFHSTADARVFDARGNTVCNWSDITKWNPNFALYWDGDLEQEVLDRTMIDGYKKGRILTAQGVNYNNGTKSNCSICADILGDWREEVVWPTADNRALRVYVSTAVTKYKIATLMHDTQYRCQVASQNVAYNQPAHTSFFLGTGYPLPNNPNVVMVGSDGGQSTPTYNPPPSNPNNDGKLDGIYYIQGVGSNLYMDIENGSTANGANLRQWSYNGCDAQKFKLVSDGEGNYFIYTGATGYKSCIDIEYADPENGANAVQWEYNGGYNQKYKIESNSDGTYSIRTLASNNESALDVFEKSTKSGANINQWKYNGGANQRWKLISVN